jgi:hypothetical protein
MGPFTYPAEKHVRRHGPQGYRDLESYRPWLRDEFSFRCVYCLIREQWGRTQGMFDIDHFVPIALDPTGALLYDNLLYACATCNAAKGKQRIHDPCQVLLAGNVYVEEDGKLVASSSKARQIIRVLGSTIFSW